MGPATMGVGLGALLLVRYSEGQATPQMRATPDGNITFVGTQTGGVGVVTQTGYQPFTTVADVAALQASLASTMAQVRNLTTQVARLQGMQDTRCPLPALVNGTVSAPPELLVGSMVSFTCAPTHELVGNSTAYCLTSGAWSLPAPTCVNFELGSAPGVPAPSCRAIFLDRRVRNLPAVSGAYWLQFGTAAPFEAFCDMTTPAQNGLSGWTLCGKYDRDSFGSQYLSQGFGRQVFNVGDMSTLNTFSSTDNKWSSLDCRPLLNRQSMWMMHAGTDNITLTPNESYGNPNQTTGKVRFTNILADAKQNPTNFFNLANEDRGVCVPRTAGAISTFNRSWVNLGTTEDESVTSICPETNVNFHCGNLELGSCLVGDGHHFCSSSRAGARLSNAGTAGCTGSQADTVYWAWLADDHYCNSVLRIGTGCNGQPATYRYNFLFLY